MSNVRRYPPTHPVRPHPAQPAVVDGEVIDLPPPVDLNAPRPSEETSSGDRVVAVAMAVTVTSIAVLGVLSFLSDDDDEPSGRGR